MTSISQIFWINLIMFIWFNTDAFISYSSVIPFKKFFKIKGFLEYSKINPKADYTSWLRINEPGFIYQLITCKPCFGFWITLIVCLIYSNLVIFPILYLTSYVIYKISNKYVY